MNKKINMKLLLLLPLIFGMTFLCSDFCEGSRILGVFPLNVRSHFMMFEALLKGLARKGHQVDVVGVFPLKEPYPNYTDIYLLPTNTRMVNNMTFEYIRQWSNFVTYLTATEFGNKLCDGFENPNLQKLIKNPPKHPPYDLLITELAGAHCFMALGPHLGIPMIGMSSSVLYPWVGRVVGTPANLAFVPNNIMEYIAPMNFWQRFHNVVSMMYEETLYQYLTKPQDDIIKKYFGEDAPGVRETEKNLALVFTNSHPSLNGPRPISPAVIEVGGLHVQDDGPELPEDLNQWMNESTEGFIYFSFGSMVTIESLSDETIKTFYKSLGKIAPTRVLIKIPKPKLLPPGLPNNWRTFEWASQIKVLKHKNIKAFITHGGLMGTQEAIHYGVPLIGMPLFADQFVNVDLYVSKKIAIKLSIDDVTEEKLDAALNQILYNPKYKNAALELSAKFRARPMSAMETAIWWVEYVIRRGGDTLRSPTLDLAWWQVELLDVYLVLLLILVFTISLAILLIHFLTKTLLAHSTQKTRYTKVTKKVE